MAASAPAASSAAASRPARSSPRRAPRPARTRTPAARRAPTAACRPPSAAPARRPGRVRPRPRAAARRTSRSRRDRPHPRPRTHTALAPWLSSRLACADPADPRPRRQLRRDPRTRIRAERRLERLRSEVHEGAHRLDRVRDRQRRTVPGRRIRIPVGQFAGRRIQRRATELRGLDQVPHPPHVRPPVLEVVIAPHEPARPRLRQRQLEPQPAGSGTRSRRDCRSRAAARRPAPSSARRAGCDPWPSRRSVGCHRSGNSRTAGCCPPSPSASRPPRDGNSP